MDNTKEEVVTFNTIFVSGRYGLTDRINLSAIVPLLDLEVTKRNKLDFGASSADDYTRLMRGVGDVLLLADMRFGSSPQVTVEAGLKLATGSVDKVDDYSQPLDPILQPGSGTTDLVLGVSFWTPHFMSQGVDLMGALRHRFVAGQNKWGYTFGDQTQVNLHASKPYNDYRVGLRLEGLHCGQDTWFLTDHQERGATILTLGPTLAWDFAQGSSLGASVQFPVYMHLNGSQLVDTGTFGLSLNTDLTDTITNLFGSDDEDGLE